MTAIAYLGLFGYFAPGGSPTYFGLGRGAITPPGPAMVRTGKGSKLKKKTIECFYLAISDIGIPFFAE